MPASPGTIVVPLDGSKNAELAIPVAAELASAFGVGVRFVHAAEDAAVKTPEALSTAGKTLSDYVAGLQSAHNLKVDSCEVLKGSAARQVIDDSRAARFVVLSSHGRGGMKATFVGSVADKLVRGAQVPTVIVPVDCEPKLAGRPMVVGVDGSPAAEKALATAREIATKLKMQVVIVRAYDFPPAVGVEFAYYPVDIGSALEEGSEEYLASIKQAGEKTVTRQGYAGTVISEVADAEDAGLVVVASHGKNVLERIAMGSTTDRLMHSLKRPLLVVPAGG